MCFPVSSLTAKYAVPQRHTFESLYLASSVDKQAMIACCSFVVLLFREHNDA